MDIEKYVAELVNGQIADRDDLFLVDVKFVPGGKLSILVDGDQGISIQDCAAISRHVGNTLEEENVIETAYNIEVSSPRIDTPLRLERQYLKNIGRTISVKLSDGRKHEGTLLEHNAQGITIKEKIKEKGKKAFEQDTFIESENIVETKVLISFK